jgi:hypothetical protein
MIRTTVEHQNPPRLNYPYLAKGLDGQIILICNNTHGVVLFQDTTVFATGELIKINELCYNALPTGTQLTIIQQ